MGALPFKLVAGHLALDFVNTLDNRYVPERTINLVPGYDDLLRFSLEARIVSAPLARKLERLGEREHSQALHSAWLVRETLYEAFTLVARGNAPSRESLDDLNACLKAYLRHRRLERDGPSLKWGWAGSDMDPAAPLWPIVFEAAELLASGDAQFVRECGSPTCRWLFLDLSKNHTRRWCDMKVCGNRTKARRYYQRHTTDPQ